VPPAGSDIDDLLQLLTRAQIGFVVIGGVAVNLHGYTRNTADLDILYRRTRENVHRLAGVLQEIRPAFRVGPGVPPVPAPIEERAIWNGDRFTLTTDLADFDLMATADGVSSYDEVEARALALDVGGCTVLVAAIPDLIAMKQAANRPRVRDDIEALLKIQSLTPQAGG